jgi:hypothetical protein
MSTTQEEQRGIAKVHQVCAEMEAIWRPTPNVDVGIDGQIEFLEPGRNISSGKIFAVQVKSGASYFKTEKNYQVNFSVKPRHRRYWSLVNLPMLLILHHHDRDLTLFSFVKQQLARGGPISLHLRDRFESAARKQILAGYKDEEREIRRLIQPDRILHNFGDTVIRNNPRLGINGLHFLLSCIDPACKYFELRYRRLITGLMIIDKRFSLDDPATREFIQRCVVKCWGYEL